MLTYSNARNLLVILIAGLFVTSFFTSISWVIWLLVIAPFLALFTWGSMSITSSFYLPVINKAEHSKREVAISFDDGPHPEVTPKLIDIIDKHGVKATFFCIGKNVEGNESILKNLYTNGHIIGNHTYSHQWYLPFLPARILQKDIEKTDLKIQKAIGVKPKLFRPPFGVTSPRYYSALKNLGHSVIGWNVRSLDTVINDSDKLFEKVNRGIKGGDIILFHDNNPNIVPFIDRFLNHLAKNGIKVVPMDELLNIKAYEA